MSFYPQVPVAQTVAVDSYGRPMGAVVADPYAAPGGTVLVASPVMPMRRSWASGVRSWMVARCLRAAKSGASQFFWCLRPVFPGAPAGHRSMRWARWVQHLLLRDLLVGILTSAHKLMGPTFYDVEERCCRLRAVRMATIAFVSTHRCAVVHAQPAMWPRPLAVATSAGKQCKARGPDAAKGRPGLLRCKTGPEAARCLIIASLQAIQPLVRLISATSSALQLLRCAVPAAVLRSRRVRTGSRGELLVIARRRLRRWLAMRDLAAVHGGAVVARVLRLREVEGHARVSAASSRARVCVVF